jgi:DHA2 family multidrug resistance protein
MPDRTLSKTIRIWAGFGLMCIGMFMAILDVQIVATSLPTIQRALGIAPDQMSWVQTAYLIAEIIAIPLTGVLMRALSMRWLFVAAITVFTLASAGCAASGDFTTLIVFRVVQGFAGGSLIPTVFAAVFLMFSGRWQGVATTVAGVLAVLAPTIGPIAGGWLTETYSWHWLFLINIVPGVLVIPAAILLLPRFGRTSDSIGSLDWAALAAMAIALTALEIGLKEAPDHGWRSPLVLGLMLTAAVGAALFVTRSLRSRCPVADCSLFADRNFAIGSALSFVLGIGLFGTTYLMPFFLGLVRGHNALQIGEIMLVTGGAQLASAPVAAWLEQRVDPRLLSAFGFLVFGVGIGLSAWQPATADFREMILPQALRGAAIMFCLLPPTRIAMGHLRHDQIADGSGLFNLMRNLGGAIGLALIDTVIFSRVPTHVSRIAAELQKGNDATALAVGIPLDVYQSRPAGPIDPEIAATLKPMVEHLALAQSINDAWALIAVLTLVALLLIPFATSSRAVDDRAI